MMTQNPYAQQSGFDQPPVVARTSIAAILSLVCALVCFIPGMGVLAIILGLAAIFMIGSSQGRVGGKGLAISGILIGLLVSLAWVGLFYGARQVGKMVGQQFMGNATSFFQSVEAQDYAKARTILNTPSGSPVPTDEQFDAFVAGYQAEVGTFQSMPSGIIELLGSYSKLQGFNLQQAPGQIPIPAEFSQGTAIVILEMPQGFQTGSTPNPNAIPIINIGVLSRSGTTVWLIPRLGTTTPGTPPPAPTPPAGEGGNADTPPPSGNGG